MQFDLNEAIQVLQRTPPALDGLLRGMPDHWLRANEGPGTFSVLDVLGHLIHGETDDWIPRARIVLESGESRAFTPFDRRGFETAVANKSADELLDLFSQLRRQNLNALRGLQLENGKLDRTGMHPELGRVTMRELLATWAVHDLSHVGQITRVMARQYGEEVGPWRAYITILNR